MPHDRSHTTTTRNRILEALPAVERARLGEALDRVPLSFKQMLYEPDEPIPYVYFPEDGVVSMVVTSTDGATVEVATVGNEGVVGLPVFLGSVSTSGTAFSQVPGEALRMKSVIFREETSKDGPLRHLLNRYTQALFDQIAQGSACNRIHPMEQRCARWLLMTQDRVDAPDFPLTHEFLSHMLGVRRASVTEAIGALQDRALIQHARGRMTVVDRGGLEGASCPCYRRIREAYERLMAPD